MQQRLAAGQSNHVTNRFVEVEPSLAWGRLLDESTDSADDVSGPVSAFDYFIERLPHLLQIGRVGAQTAQGHVGIGDRRCDGLVHLMGDRGRELAHGRNAIDVRELGMRLLQCLLRSLALGDVDGGAHEFDEVAGRAQNRMAYGTGRI